MKSPSPVVSSKSTPTLPAVPTTDRESFFERAYLSLLGSALAQFEARDERGGLLELYNHPKLEHEADIEEEEESQRIEELVDRCYRMALEATRRYFEERVVSSFNAEV